MSSTFRFVWDGNVLLHETFKKDNSENTELTTWVFEGFVPTAKLVNGKSYSIISDHLGTPILAVDSDGMEVWNRQLDIYGRVRKEYKHSSLGDEVFPFVPFLYQGQYYDFETGLCYNRFRYYSPETGAYISQDPIGLAGGNPNLYAYVKDSSCWVDRFGLEVLPEKDMAYLLREDSPSHYKVVVSFINPENEKLEGKLYHLKLERGNKIDISVSSIGYVKETYDELKKIKIDSNEISNKNIKNVIKEYQGKEYKLNKKDCFSFVIDFLNKLGANIKPKGTTNLDKFNNIKSTCV